MHIRLQSAQTYIIGGFVFGFLRIFKDEPISDLTIRLAPKREHWYGEQ